MLFVYTNIYLWAKNVYFGSQNLIFLAQEKIIEQQV